MSSVVATTMIFDTKVDEVLKKLIAFDTTSHKSNLDLMAYIQDYLEFFGVKSTLFHNEEKTKANLFAKIANNASSKHGGIVFSGHTDTVPITGQNWTKPPYELTIENNKFFGRGTADMKSFIALVLAFIPEFVKHKFELPLYLAFSYDEEVGCVGVRPMLEVLKKQGIQPSLCIIGEPTNLKLVSSHKGKVGFKVEVFGKDCHSALATQGVNAITYAAKIVNFLQEIAESRCTSGPFDKGFNTPFSTLSVGTISGGTATNIVPRFCQFVFEFRNIPKDDFVKDLVKLKHFADKLTQKMQEIDSSCGIKIKQTNEYPALEPSNDKQTLALIKRLAVSDTGPNIDFGTEGGLFKKILGVNSIIFGPGSMQQGHKQDEYVTYEQLKKGEVFFKNFIKEFS